MELADLPIPFSPSSCLGSNGLLFLVYEQEGSPMTSFEAETDSKRIIIFQLLTKNLTTIKIDAIPFM